MEKLDLKSILTIIVILTLTIFVGYILWSHEISTELISAIVMAYILFANKIADHYFGKENKKGEDKNGKQ